MPKFKVLTEGTWRELANVAVGISPTWIGAVFSAYATAIDADPP
jgi:hypothetical protein